MPPLKILHIIPSLSARRGGPTEVALALVRGLRQQKIEAEIATTTDDGGGTLAVKTGEFLEYRGVPVIFFPRCSPPWKPGREFAYASSFLSWLQRKITQYDLIHVHALFSFLPTCAMACARRQNVPYLVTTHGLLGKWPLQQNGALKKIYGQLLERRNLQGASALHFTSRAEAEEAAALALTSPPSVIPPGLDLPLLLPQAGKELRSRYDIRPEETVVLFLSRFHPKKALDLLFPALAGLPQIRLILAGEGDATYERWMRTELARTFLGQRTIWTGFVSGEEKNLLLQGADLLALPSRHENFGLVVLEALAGGTRVLVSDQVALAEEVQAHRLGAVSPLAVAPLRQALIQLLDEAEAKPVLRLREFVADHYAWPKIAGKMIALYQDILARHSSRAKIR